MRCDQTFATLTALVALLGSGCVDIPGLEPGDPCNTNGICVEGLVCQEGVCVDNSAISWEVMSRPYSHRLQDVWGAGAKNVFAVGSSGTILRYQGNGLQWTGQEKVISGGLYAVWGRSASEVWAVGDNSVLHFDGSSWTPQEVLDTDNKPITSFTLKDVHGDSKIVIAVGYRSYNKPLVLRHDADQRWRQIKEVTPSYNCQGVFVHGGRVWIVGTAAHVLNMTDGTWAPQNLPVTKNDPALVAIWGADANNIVAVGPTKTLARFNGKDWTLSTEARGAGLAHGIWGASAGEFYVAGAASGSSYNNDQRSGIERCNPSCATNPVLEDLRSKTLYGVWGDGKAIFAVGDNGTILRRSQ